MLTKITRSVVFIMLALALISGTAQAASFTYGTQGRKIAAGVIEMPVVTDQQYAFYILNERGDIKPAGWDFYNPIGQGADKSSGTYWKVNLSKASFDDIAKFNVLLFAVNGSINNVDRSSREKLRRFVDGGGVLWIDNQVGSFGDTTFLVNDLNFITTGVGLTPAYIPDSVLAHPLVNRPYHISWQDINNLGTADMTTIGRAYATGAGGAGLPDPSMFVSIVNASNNSPIVSGAAYGSGFIVVTAESVAKGIEENVVNAGALYTDFLGLSSGEDLRLACNIVNWASEHTTQHKNARRSGFSFNEIGRDLSLLWEYVPESPQTENRTSPAMLDDMVFYVDDAFTLHVFDLSPMRDRDGDGSPDDGGVTYRDQSLGLPYDEIWSDDLSAYAPISSPSAAYVPQAGVATPVVAVVTGGGNALAYAYDPNTGTFTSLVLGGTETFNAFTSAALPAPTFCDSVLYWGDGMGTLHGRDFVSGQPWFVAPGSPMGECTASPTVGYVRDPSSGTVDQVVYLATQASTGATPGNGNIRPFPIKTFNEVLTTNAQGTGTLTLQTRSNGNPIKDTNWQLLYIPSLGTSPIPIFPPDAGIAGNNTAFTVNMASLPPAKGAVIVADYEINPVHATVQMRNRSPINIKTAPATNYAGIPSAPALGSKDILYFATGEFSNSLYAVRETGRGITRSQVKWRWGLKDPASLSILGDCEPVGSPACAGDMVYFAVRRQSGGGYILAFDADPALTLNLARPVALGTQVTLKQLDSLNPAATAPFQVSGGVPEQQIDPSKPMLAPFVVDYDKGKIIFTNLRANGDANMDLSNSQDLTVEYTPASTTGQAVSAVTENHPVFTSQGLFRSDKWCPLKWYLPLQNSSSSGTTSQVTPTSSPMVIGNALFIGGAVDDPDGPLGVLCTVDLGRINGTYSGPADLVDTAAGLVNVDVVSEGGTDNSVYSVVAGAHGVLAVTTAEGLKVLHNPVTLVAEGGRLSEVDTTGTVLWSADSTVQYVQTTDGSSTNPVYSEVTVPFNRPSAARYASTGGIVVADTGNNRIVQIDKGGNVTWEISSFTDPSNPSLLAAGSPLTLNKPTDISTWMETAVSSDGIERPVYHYLITDSGNYRVLEIVSIYDVGTQAYQNQLAWVTKTYEMQGKEYKYITARRSYDPTLGKYITFCVIANYTPSSSGPEGVAGAVVKIDETGIIVGAPIPSDVEITNPVFFDRLFVSSDDFYDVVIDAAGVHEFYYSNGVWDGIERSFEAKSYSIGTDTVPFSPTYAQILPTGNLVVASKATGTVSGKEFSGDVVELAWDNTASAFNAVSLSGTSGARLRQPASVEQLVY